MQRKFSLVPYTDLTKPVVLYGLYKPEDFEVFRKIVGGCVVWCGTDAKALSASHVEVIKTRPEIIQYAKSKQVYETLKRKGVKSVLLPITSTRLNIKPVPRGNCVYCYICSDNPKMKDKYRYGILKKLSIDLRKIKFIFTTIKKYKYKDLINVYAKCFIGIRLLDHDGLSNSILEMGLMGRRTISNSGLPGTIPWTNYKSIRTAILKEYKHRREDNKSISESVRSHIDIGDKWLEYAS